MTKLNNLLIVTPHFKTFIKDQVMSIRNSFNKITLMIPAPYFSNYIVKMPFIGNKYYYLKITVESYNESLNDYSIISPKYFTLPIDQIQKRNNMIVAKKCLEYMKNNVINFNLVHTHFLENGLIGTVLKEEYNAPLIITGHGGDVYDVPFRSKWYNNISRYIISNANEVITVSNYNADKLLKLGASKKHLHVIPNGYSDMFKPTSKRNTRSILKLPSNKKILLSVGNLVKIKGYTYLLDAMYKLCKIRKDVILIVIGSGYLKNDLEKKVKLLGLTHNVNFIGPKKHEEIPLWMNSCDLFILPSLAEGFPTVIPEALACGKPVIASSVGGIPEIINSSVGLLIQPKNIDLLSDAIVQGIDKVWNYDFITSYSSRYSWKVLANNLLQVYNLYL